MPRPKRATATWPREDADCVARSSKFFRSPISSYYVKSPDFQMLADNSAFFFFFNVWAKPNVSVSYIQQLPAASPGPTRSPKPRYWEFMALQ